ADRLVGETPPLSLPAEAAEADGASSRPAASAPVTRVAALPSVALRITWLIPLVMCRVKRPGWVRGILSPDRYPATDQG
ncbi:hypothetical protein PL81_08175, partial [Streptomyces sp. RSD-27]